jgi:acetoin utilization deacetylase AcuC-like enzyme
MSRFTIKTFFSRQMVADIRQHLSPSARKPVLVAEALAQTRLSIAFTAPKALTPEEMSLAHSPEYVRDVLAGKRANGFGNHSTEVIQSLPFTNGALYDAALYAVNGGLVAAALSSGFHHAGYEHAADFCTFNGLMITAQLMLQRHALPRIAIIDADYHYGNGTQEILERLKLNNQVFHYSFGRDFHYPKDAKAYLEKFNWLRAELHAFKLSLILYQPGAEAHRDDPHGGVLSTQELYFRERRMFEISRDLEIPIAWNLAGGYQRDPDGGISKVIDIHLNTFRAADHVYKKVLTTSEKAKRAAQSEVDSIVETAEEFLHEHNWEGVILLCQTVLPFFQLEPRLWKALGIALASLGRQGEACRCYHSALQVGAPDGDTLSRFVTSCIKSGDLKWTGEAIEKFYPRLTAERTLGAYKV